MTHVLLAAVLLAAAHPKSRADDAPVHFSVRPMPAPKPALRYQLLPESVELSPGNAAQGYLFCFMEQRNFFFGKEAVAERARYLAMPLAELPAGQLKGYGGSALRHADRAARLDAVDWQYLQSSRGGDMADVPGEVGQLQVLARALQVRFRAEVAGRRFDDAIRTAKTLFALSRHLGEHGTEVANLVGLWVAHLTLCGLGEMVQQPGSPNLYWALTDLPCPPVDLRKGVQSGRALVASELRMLRDDAPMTESDVEQLVSRLAAMLSFHREQEGKAPRNIRGQLQGQLQALATDADRVRDTRRRLIDAGYAESLVRRFPPSHVILLGERDEFEVERDERTKLLSLPLWQVDSLAGGVEKEQSRNGLFAEFLPQINDLCRARGQLERQIALLRHVEALRLYAAGHDGKLPARLCDIPVPLPVDPLSGKPFDYTAEATTAHLRGDSCSGEGSKARYKIRYEVMITR
jgi:hypothetical protein